MHGSFQDIPDWGDSANLIFDVHEHHRSELFLSRQIQLHTLFEQSYAGWTLKRPYPLPHETWEEREMEAFAAPCRWEDVKPFLEKRGSNHFVRNLMKGILMIHGQEGDEFIDGSNWERINRRIIESRKDPGFQADWLARVGIGRVITDDYAQPMVDVRLILGKGYASVMRINAFCLSHHPSVRDHNGNNGIEPFCGRSVCFCRYHDSFFLPVGLGNGSTVSGAFGNGLDSGFASHASGESG